MAHYKDYIDLGFKREEWNDVVSERQYGYSGYFLHKRLSKYVSIEVCWRDLDNPKIYFEQKKLYGFFTHTTLTFTQVKELLKPQSFNAKTTQNDTKTT